MSYRPELTRLRNATAKLERAEAAAERARLERDAYALDALHIGASIQEVMDITDLSRSGLWLIRDAARRS